MNIYTNLKIDRLLANKYIASFKKNLKSAKTIIFNFHEPLRNNTNDERPLLLIKHNFRLMKSLETFIELKIF